MKAGDLIREEVRTTEARLRQLRSALEDLEPETGPPAADCPAFEEEVHELSWLVGGAIADRSVTMLVADPGIGKTTFVAQLTLMVSTGKRFLGMTVNSAQPTLTVQAEGSRAAYRSRLRATRASFGIEPPKTWFIQGQKMRDFALGSSGLTRMVEETKARLVVLDTLGYFASFNENNAEEWKERVMQPIRELIAKTGASFLIVHHQPKATDQNRDVRTGRGTSAMLADCDHFWLLDDVKGDGNESFRDWTVKKNKYGRAGRLRLRFDESNASFAVV